MCHERYAAKVKTSLAIVFFLLSLIAARAEAANSWNERDLNWGPPTACFDGDTDLTHCQVTGYKVEVAGSCTAIQANASLNGTHCTSGCPHFSMTKSVSAVS